MLKRIKKFYYRWLAKRRLISRYEYLNEVNGILEEYITSKILQGGSAEFLDKSRKELANKQSEIKETTLMVEFLKGIK
jgi:hypothetical protein